MKTINEIIQELEFLILLQEDDLDRGRGKYIIQEYINELKEDNTEKTYKYTYEIYERMYVWNKITYTVEAESQEIADALAIEAAKNKKYVNGYKSEIVPNTLSSIPNSNDPVEIWNSETEVQLDTFLRNEL